MKNMLWLLLLASSCFGIAGDYNADGIVNLQDYSMAANGGWNQRVVTVMENWLMADKYVQFDGSTGYVTVADANSLDLGTGNFSICFWIKIPTALADIVSIIEKKGVASTGYKIELLIGDDSGKLKVTTLGGETFIVSTPDTIADNAWHFIAVTGDKTNSPFNLSIYLDTTLVDYEPQFDNQGDMTNASDLVIGGTANFFAGSLDDIRIYKAALKAAEIAEIYNGGVGKKYAALSTGRTAAAAFNFDEGVGNYTLDAVGGLLGTKTSGVTWVSGGVPFPNSTIVDAVDIADALVTALNTNQGVFTTPFTAVRNLLPIYTTEDLASLKVTVLPASLDETVFSRAACQDDFVIHVGVQQRIAKDTDIETALPTLIGLVTEIKDFLKMKNLTSASACWVSTKIEPIYSREHLQQDKVFTSLLVVTYRVLE